MLSVDTVCSRRVRQKLKWAVAVEEGCLVRVVRGPARGSPRPSAHLPSTEEGATFPNAEGSVESCLEGPTQPKAEELERLYPPSPQYTFWGAKWILRADAHGGA